MRPRSLRQFDDSSPAIFAARLARRDRGERSSRSPSGTSQGCAQDSAAMSAPPDVDLRHLAPPPLSPPAVSSRRRGLLARVAVAALVVAVAALTLPDLVHLDHVTPFAQVVSFRPFVLAGVAALVLLAAGLSWRYRLLAPAAVALLAVLALGMVMIVPRAQVSP